ncbi:MAG: hypothetical protein Q8M19_19870 [Reyranella sp.]|nr:hypothetical protein [Reyranella sp.]
MTGKSVLNALAVGAWLMASVLAALFVAYIGFFGIGFIGLLFWSICSRIELEKEGAVGHGFSTGLFAQQIKAQTEMSPAERAALRHEQSLTVRSARFFKHLGVGLTLIGFGGFAYGQL